MAVETVETKVVEGASEQTKQPEAPFKAFATEEEFNNTIKSERSKAKGEVLNELGLKSIDEIKERITKSTTLETKLTETESKYAALQEDYEVTKIGIKEEYRSEALTLAKAKVNTEMDLGAALKAVAEKMPMMVDAVKGVRKIGNDQSNKDGEAEAAALKASLQKKYPFIK